MEDGFVLKGRTSDIYDKNTLNHKFTIGEGGKKIIAETLFRKMFNFPYFVGKSWDDKVNIISRKSGLPRTLLINYKIEGLDNINTPAGNFKAFRIFAKVSVLDQKDNAWVKFWYSPEIKFWSKHEFEKSDFFGRENAVLVDYKLHRK